MEPKPCYTCNARPRKPGRSYCDTCDRTRQRVNNRIRMGWTEAQIVEAEVEQRVREAHQATRQAAIEAEVTQRLLENPAVRPADLVGNPDVPEDEIDAEIRAFNERMARES